MNKSNWGGKRKGSGRPIKNSSKAVDSTKVCRIEKKHYEFIKTGKYDELMSVLAEYKTDIIANRKSSTSPRYQKLLELMFEVDEIFGQDWHSLE